MDSQGAAKVTPNMSQFMITDYGSSALGCEVRPEHEMCADRDRL